MKRETIPFPEWRQSPTGMPALLPWGMTDDVRRTLWANVRFLMIRKYGSENLNQLARQAGIGMATAQRIKASTQYVRSDTIEKVAEHFKIEPWQLLMSETADEKFLDVISLWRKTDGRGRRMLIGAVRGATHEDAEQQQERPVSRKTDR